MALADGLGLALVHGRTRRLGLRTTCHGRALAINRALPRHAQSAKQYLLPSVARPSATSHREAADCRMQSSTGTAGGQQGERSRSGALGLGSTAAVSLLARLDGGFRLGRRLRNRRGRLVDEALLVRDID